jgi:hypothetical protein
MFKTTVLLMALVSIALAAIGCQGDSTPSGAGKPAPNKVSADSSGSKSVREALAKLSPEDRARAEAQRLCPSSNELLGSMGAPVKVTLKGQTVFLCCASCKDEAEKDPEAMLQKIASSKAKDSHK